ncbi:MAG: TetR/AcrR family transcriptional regulator [Fusicatenibacter sp.]
MENEIKLTYVQEKITRALLELMKQYPFREITVTQVVQHAEISRASFYRNYRNNEEVLRYYMTILIKNWGTSFESAGDLDWAGSLLMHYYHHKEFYSLLYQCNLSHNMLAIIRETIGVDAESQNVAAYGKAWFAGGLFGWIEEWIRRGMQETPEQLKALMKDMR